MQRISNTEVQFTKDEMLLVDLHDDLLDGGFGTVQAVEMIQLSEIPESVRDARTLTWLTPEFVSATLTGAFLSYLHDEDPTNPVR